MLKHYQTRDQGRPEGELQAPTSETQEFNPTTNELQPGSGPQESTTKEELQPQSREQGISATKKELQPDRGEETGQTQPGRGVETQPTKEELAPKTGA